MKPRISWSPFLRSWVCCTRFPGGPAAVALGNTPLDAYAAWCDIVARACLIGVEV
jgi:hypothetical protein